MEKLRVTNLRKEYEGRDVLKSISFSVEEGEFLSVLGPSGCGKTTLLRILIGLEQQSDGEILLDGSNIENLPSSKRGMGIIFQNYALFPNMTVLENVQYALTLRPELMKGAKNIALRTLEQIGMSEHLQKRPAQLSGVGLIKGRDTQSDVVRVFQYIVNDGLLYDKMMFNPGQVLKNQVNMIENYPEEITYANMCGLDNLELKDFLLLFYPNY